MIYTDLNERLGDRAVQVRRATVKDTAGSAACRLVGNSRANMSMLETKEMLLSLTILKSQIFWVTTNIHNLLTWTK